MVRLWLSPMLQGHKADNREDSRTLESYNIRPGFVIRLLTVSRSQAATPMRELGAGAKDERILKTVFVKSANGPSIAMRDVRLLMTIENFREQYCEKQGTDPEHCRLLFSGKELEDSRGGAGERIMSERGVHSIFMLCVLTPIPAMTLKDYNVQNVSHL